MKRPRQNSRARTAAARTASAIGIVAGLAAVSCINASIPLAPECTPAIGLDPSTQDVQAGDTFVVTATHRGEECLSNLMWRVEGPITLRAAEGHSATIRADASGTGTIRVQNDKGSLGVLDIEIQEDEEGGAARGS